jgi:Tfp pilus assembly protein PilN
VRELEFLPDWYPKVRQRKRMVALQAWVTLILACGLGLWVLLVQRNVHAREVELRSLRSDLTDTEKDLHRLEDLLQLQRQLAQQDQIFAKIGRPVEATKLVSTLEQMMPRDMALLDLNLDTEEPPKAPASPMYGRNGQPIPQKREEPKLRFKIHGVAPTDVDVAEFIAKLTGKPFFKNVELTYTHERVESGHVMREFEIGFVMELSGLTGPMGSATAAAATGADGGATGGRW